MPVEFPWKCSVCFFAAQTDSILKTHHYFQHLGYKLGEAIKLSKDEPLSEPSLVEEKKNGDLNGCNELDLRHNHEAETTLFPSYSSVVTLNGAQPETFPSPPQSQRHGGTAKQDEQAKAVASSRRLLCPHRPGCGYISADEYELNQHLASYHKVKPIGASAVPAGQPKATSAAQVTQLKAASAQLFRCPHQPGCFYVSTDKYKLNHHLASFHKVKPKGASAAPAGQPKATFATPVIQPKATLAQLFECHHRPGCSYVSANRNDLAHHLATYHKQVEPVGTSAAPDGQPNSTSATPVAQPKAASAQLFKCLHWPGCCYVAADQNDLDHHLATYHQVKPNLFMCPICPYSTDNKSSVFNHSILHHNTQLIPCPGCNFLAVSNRKLNAHICPS